MGDDRSTPCPRHKLCLAEQDICLTRKSSGPGAGAVQATVLCPIDETVKGVEQCASCPRFVRIDVHEAGYTIVCHSADHPLEPEPEDDET